MFGQQNDAASAQSLDPKSARATASVIVVDDSAQIRGRAGKRNYRGFAKAGIPCHDQRVGQCRRQSLDPLRGTNGLCSNVLMAALGNFKPDGIGHVDFGKQVGQQLRVSALNSVISGDELTTTRSIRIGHFLAQGFCCYLKR